MIRYIIGMILMAESAFMVLPMLVSVFYKEYDVLMPFVYSILAAFAASLVFGLKKPKNDLVFARESYIAVAGGWIFVSIFGAMPFYLSGAIPSIVDAVFETVSGFTTTGATILASVDNLPKGILFWRAFTHWIGGMGIIMFLLMLTQFSDGHSLYIMRAEVPGPTVGKIAPKSSSNALILYGIYEALHYRKRHIGLDEGNAHLMERILDILFSKLVLPEHAPESAGQPLSKIVKHIPVSRIRLVPNQSRDYTREKGQIP